MKDLCILARITRGIHKEVGPLEIVLRPPVSPVWTDDSYIYIWRSLKVDSNLLVGTAKEVTILTGGAGAQWAFLHSYGINYFVLLKGASVLPRPALQ
jgi:hypothetical protein